MQSAIGYKQGIITKSACKIAKKLRYDNKKAQLFLLSLNSGWVFRMLKADGILWKC